MVRRNKLFGALETVGKQAGLKYKPYQFSCSVQSVQSVVQCSALVERNNVFRDEFEGFIKKVLGSILLYDLSGTAK